LRRNEIEVKTRRDTFFLGAPDPDKLQGEEATLAAEDLRKKEATGMEKCLKP